MGIEYVVGSESHTSYWGKFYVKGLESWEVKEEHDANRRDGHHSYAFLMADAPQGTVFTIFEQNGSKRGTDEFIFKICVVTGSDSIEHKATYGSGFCNGNYEVQRKSQSAPPDGLVASQAIRRQCGTLRTPLR